MTDLSLVGRGATRPVTEDQPGRGSARRSADSRRGPAAGLDGCRADPFAAAKEPRRSLRIRWNSSYGLSAFVGVVTYLAYGSLNHAWDNWVLFAVAVYMFLSIPIYSKLSNKIEFAVTKQTRLETGGRIARYLPQLLVNLVLLWVFVEGQVIDPSGLVGIGGFFATGAWITIVSQGGQYLANWLARRNVGDADRNVVLAVSISAIVNALAVSGVTWIHPIYIALSLCFGAVIFGVGVVADTRVLSKRVQF
jgi:hypothetical protein